MKNNNGCCGCSTLSNFTICDEQTQTSSDEVEMVLDSSSIQPNDQILIIRKNKEQTQVYKVSFNDLSPEVALIIIEKATQVMSRTDPADGKSLWIDEGFIRIASGDPSYLGALSPTAIQKSLAEAFKILPTSDPGDGSPWLNGGVLMQGSNNNDNHN